MISQALRIHESTVACYLSDYALAEKLKPENGGSQSLLSDTQTMQHIEHLTEKTYFHTRQIITYVEDGKPDNQDNLFAEEPSGKSEALKRVPKKTRSTFVRNRIFVVLGFVFIAIAALFPLVFTAKAPKLTSWLPLTKMFSSEVLTVYCDNDEETKLVGKGIKLMISMEVKQGGLSRLILAHSQESLSSVILKPLVPPVNLVVLFESPRSTDDLVGVVKAELSRYVH